MKGKGQQNPEKWQEYQNVYSRLQNLDENRLQISSLLGGLTLTAFSLLTASLNFQVSVLDSAHILLIVVPTLLAIATLIFLASAYSAYQSIRQVGNLSSTNARNLENSQNDEDAALRTLTKPRSDLTQPAAEAMSDAVRLRIGWHIHWEASGLISIGLSFLGIALIGITLEINWLVAAFAVICVTYLFWRLRMLSRTPASQAKYVQQVHD